MSSIDSGVADETDKYTHSYAFYQTSINRLPRRTVTPSEGVAFSKTLTIRN
ncbi:hypothetical protein [Pontibacter mangrovi]|uniref:hypothetical protein n=1 Tax=Pontibacter mangrovi TaxID=2589816 RepID=UPI0015E44038|nr:hypothetical protein [Pontibacter mangrovi]